MNYLSKIVNSVISKSSWDSVFLKNLETKYFGDTIDTKPYKTSQLVYVCISTTARSISQVPLMVMRPADQPNKKSTKALTSKQFVNLKYMSLRSDVKAEETIDKSIKSGELEPVEASNPYQVLLDNPNPYMDGTILKYATICYILLDGNTWIIPFPPDAKLPLQLWITARDSMEPNLDRTNGHLTGWKYRPKGLQFSVTLKPEEVSHLRFWSPYDNIMGQAPLDAGKIDIRTDYKASVYNENFFDEGAVPEGIVYTDKVLGPDKKNRTLQDIEGRHKGYRKSHRLMVLDRALKFQRIGLTQRDMQHKEMRSYSREQVFQLFGMKKSIVSVTDDLNYATAESQKKGWWQDNNLPLMRMVSAALNHNRVFANSPYIVWWDKSSIEALREDYSGKVDTAKKLFDMGKSFKQVNEMLELGFDVEPVDEINYLPSTYQKVGEKGIPFEEPEPETLPTEEPEKIILPGSVKFIESKGWEDKSQSVWDDLDAKMNPLKTTFEAKVKRTFYEMRKSVLKMAGGVPYADQKVIGKAKPSPQQLLSDIDTVNFQREKDLIESLTSGLYENSIQLGAESIASELGIGISFDIVDPIVLQYIAVRRLKVKGILDTIKKQIRLQIHDGMQEGESIDQIANRIRSVFDTSKKRAVTIARTEVIGTTNFGRYTQIQFTGYTRKIWFTAKDERVREQHGLMHGNKVKVEERWTFEDGTTVRYPGDYSGAAHQVINCRCIETVDQTSFDASRLGPISQQDINNLGRNS